MWKSVLNCFRRAPAKRAASGGGAAATGYVVPKIVVDYLPTWVVKTAMAAGGLVCVGVLIWVPVYADDWSGWTPTSQQEVLREPRPFGEWTGMDAPGGGARRTVGLVQTLLWAEFLDSPTLLFPVTAEASQNYASAPSPYASLPQSPATSSGHSSTGSDVTTVPEPSSILLYLVGMGGMIITAACGLMFDRLYRALRR